MATFVEELCDDLETEGLFTKGTDVFYNHIPDTDITPATIAVLTERGGSANTAQQAPEMLVNVMVRSATDYDTARAAAADIYNYYHTMTNKTLTNKRVISSIAQGLPAGLGEDSNRRHLVGFNIIFKVVSIDQTIDITATGIGGAKDPDRENA